MNEKLLIYILKYQSEDCAPKKDASEKREHYGFIYSKIMKNTYAPIAIKHAR